MPPLVQSVMVDAAKTRFRAFNLSLPTVAPTGPPPNIGQFLLKGGAGSAQSTLATSPKLMSTTKPSAFTSSLITQRTAAPVPTATPQPLPLALIKASSNAKADVAFQAQVSDELSSTIDAICAAIVGAHTVWRQQAFLCDVQIMGATATGGSVQGPSLSPFIKASVLPAALFGTAAAIAQAVADGLDTAWQNWQASVSVPGLPWFPSFVAFPGPVAPPTPNVPSPLVALKWNPATISVDSLTQAMKFRQLTPAPYSNELFTSIATGFARALEMWFPVQMVANVLGRGPVPTFAPPYVPVGPVVGGDVIAAPGHFNW